MNPSVPKRLPAALLGSGAPLDARRTHVSFWPIFSARASRYPACLAVLEHLADVCYESGTVILRFPRDRAWLVPAAERRRASFEVALVGASTSIRSIRFELMPAAVAPHAAGAGPRPPDTGNLNLSALSPAKRATSVPNRLSTPCAAAKLAVPAKPPRRGATLPADPAAGSRVPLADISSPQRKRPITLPRSEEERLVELRSRLAMARAAYRQSKAVNGADADETRRLLVVYSEVAGAARSAERHLDATVERRSSAGEAAPSSPVLGRRRSRPTQPHRASANSFDSPAKLAALKRLFDERERLLNEEPRGASDVDNSWRDGLKDIGRQL
jgi:hypothetical protein